MMTEEEAVQRGALIASRAILSAILVTIHEAHGYETVRRIRGLADGHVEAARHRMLSGGTSVEWTDDAKESASAAEGFLDDAFAAAYAAE